MMTDEQAEAYRALPETVTIYRGCSGQRRIDGICWSLDEGVAARFPSLQRYRVEDPVLAIAEIKKQYILAMIGNDRGEAEVITFRADVLDVMPLIVEESPAMMGMRLHSDAHPA